MVGCFILGSGNSFNFEIGEYNNFTNLRKAIWKSDKSYFENIGESIGERNEIKLNLWKVEISTRDNIKYEELKKNPHVGLDVKKEFGGEWLDPVWEIEKSYSDTPAKEHIHIIVQPTIGKCLPMFYLSSKEMFEVYF
jgi:hypothetical protein